VTPGEDEAAPEPAGLEFPGPHPVRVMGRDGAEFRAAVMAVFARRPGFPAASVTERLSRDRTYVSICCTLELVDRAELELLYAELRATGLVLYAL
jgi:putative lipoic acid-binding regulatory protein